MSEQWSILRDFVNDTELTTRKLENLATVMATIVSQPDEVPRAAIELAARCGGHMFQLRQLLTALIYDVEVLLSLED